MNYIDYYKTGSGIHIKKKNRGKFTDYCGGKVTEECIQKGKHSTSAAIRKRATFAANARTWKHLTGGRVYFNAEENDKERLLIIDPRKENLATLSELSTNTESTNQLDNNWISSLLDSLNTLTQSSQQSSSQQSSSKSTSNSDGLSEDMKTLLGMFNNAGIRVRVTSGYRAGAKTNQGNVSHHSTGNAIDVVPENGDFAALATAIRSNHEISSFMRSKGLGIIDETTPEMLAKTGGTGAHYHIGPDRLGLNFWIV